MKKEDEQLAEFENELRKLKPIRFEIKLPSPPERKVKGVSNRRFVVSIFTHAVCILLGVTLGAKFFNGTAKPPEEKAIDPPVNILIAQNEPSKTVDMASRTEKPFDIDAMICDYNKRSELLANIPRGTFSFSTPTISNDPNSLMQLRKQM